MTTPPYPENLLDAERWERDFRLKWERDFRKNVHCHPAAKKAWRDIERHGICDHAKWLLSGYALRSADAIPRALPKNATRVADAFDTASRAVRVAEERKDDPRADMFAERRKDEARKLASELWVDPDPNSPVKTVADALVAMPELGALPIDCAASVIRTEAEGVRREGGKPFLLILRDYAQKHGLKLGWERVAALAVCAHPEVNTSEVCLERTLRRWAGKPHVVESRPAFLLGFEKIFPPPAR